MAIYGRELPGDEAMTQRQPRAHNGKHLDFIRALPCVVCGNNIETQAAHIRYSALEAGKRHSGITEKPDDKWTIPLCGRHHMLQHASNERLWWECKGIDPIKVCQELWEVTGDHERGCEVLQAHRAALVEN